MPYRMKGVSGMYVGYCKRFGGCEFRVYSESFKVCFNDCIHYAKGKLYRDPEVDCIVFEIGQVDDAVCYIAISRTGITIEIGDKLLDIDRINGSLNI